MKDYKSLYGHFFRIALYMLCVVFLVSCGKKKNTPTKAPNSDVTYEKGADLTGVVKKIDEENGTVTFYNPVLEGEETFLYTGATSIQTVNGAEMVMSEVQVGEVYDLYIDKVGSGLTDMKATQGIVEENDATLSVDVDNHMLTVDDVNYQYSDLMVSLSDGMKIDPMEITAMDRVTFRGVKGKAYSVIVTKGHGYVEPVEYGDFVGGTLTVEGEAVLPITEGMLITVPEGQQKFSMKNGDLTSQAVATVERNQVARLNMKESMTQIPDTSRVSFHIYPEGAELYVNGQMVDYSKPITMYYGIHSIKVVLEGYNSYSGNIAVKDPEPTFRIDLAEETATVEESNKASADQSSVTEGDGAAQQPSDVDYDVDHKISVSAPNGASVYINGTYKGVAPCTFTKNVGKITITLQKDGYQTKSYTMEIIDDNQDTTLSFPDLEVKK